MIITTTTRHQQTPQAGSSLPLLAVEERQTLRRAPGVIHLPHADHFALGGEIDHVGGMLAGHDDVAEAPERVMRRDERKAGQVRYGQCGQAEKSPDLAISDLSRFLCPYCQRFPHRVRATVSPIQSSHHACFRSREKQPVPAGLRAPTYSDTIARLWAAARLERVEFGPKYSGAPGPPFPSLAHPVPRKLGAVAK
jgi:hypothetical protein